MYNKQKCEEENRLTSCENCVRTYNLYLQCFTACIISSAFTFNIPGNPLGMMAAILITMFFAHLANVVWTFITNEKNSW